MTNSLFNEQDALLLEAIMNSRRDVRGNYFDADKPVDELQLTRILAAAETAPSVGYSQPWEFVVIDQPEIKARVAESFKEENEHALTLFEDQRALQYQRFKLEGIYEAPINIAVFYHPSQTPVLGQTSMTKTGEYSVVCAIQNMWLMARALNIGIGWVSIVDPEKVRNILKMPSDRQLVAYLCIGHVKQFLDEPELLTAKWEKRKPIDTLIHRNSYRKKGVGDT